MRTLSARKEHSPSCKRTCGSVKQHLGHKFDLSGHLLRN